MTSKKNKARVSKADLKKPGKKKPNVLDTERISYVDYKDVNLLQRFMSDRSKIRGQRIAGTSVQQQREIATAVKNAREMALLPYTKRVASARAPRPGNTSTSTRTAFLTATLQTPRPPKRPRLLLPATTQRVRPDHERDSS
jgi:small subunit ribosomal protein S18